MGRDSNIILTCAGLTEACAPPAPEGYTLRAFRKGDERTWYDVWQRADKLGQIDRTDIYKEFAAHRQLIPDRMFFVDYEDESIATGSVWITDKHRSYPQHELWGQLHSIAVVPEHQGKGVGKWLCRNLMNASLEIGYKNLYVETSRDREDAVRLYIALGFENSNDII